MLLNNRVYSFPLFVNPFLSAIIINFIPCYILYDSDFPLPPTKRPDSYGIRPLALQILFTDLLNCNNLSRHNTVYILNLGIYCRQLCYRCIIPAGNPAQRITSAQRRQKKQGSQSLHSLRNCCSMMTDTAGHTKGYHCSQPILRE